MQIIESTKGPGDSVIILTFLSRMIEQMLRMVLLREVGGLCWTIPSPWFVGSPAICGATHAPETSIFL